MAALVDRRKKLSERPSTELVALGKEIQQMLSERKALRLSRMAKTIEYNRKRRASRVGA